MHHCSVQLNNVMKGIYEDCSKVKRSGHHGSKNPEEAVEIIVNDLLRVMFSNNSWEGQDIHHLQSLNQISWMLTRVFYQWYRTGLKSGKESMKLLITELYKSRTVVYSCTGT